jgi:hypothetical protein
MKEKYTNTIIVHEEFNGCKLNSIWPVTNGLQKTLKWSTITVTA